MDDPVKIRYPLEISAFFEIPSLLGARFTEYPAAPVDGNGVNETVKYHSVGGSLRFRPVSFENEKVIFFSPTVLAGFDRFTPWMRREEGGELEGISDLGFSAFDAGVGGLSAAKIGSHNYVGVTYAVQGSGYQVADPLACPEDQVDRYGSCEDTSLEMSGGIPVPVHPALFPEKGLHLTLKLGAELSLGVSKNVHILAGGGMVLREIRTQNNPDADKVHFITGNLRLGAAVAF